ncbi:Detected protein of confused Function [Hibiscus syriacus]|uniref:Detected protein of confused Function n=1 Tax=Hibiscus syriacus TaxID=106335 RepID=A0A6A3BWL9_HIBSY|nr:Detected protein of confused Function [Hibiscus syriacus]
MPITSFSLFRYRSPTVTTVFLRHLYPNRRLSILAAKQAAKQSPSDPRQQNASRRTPPNKNLLKAKHVLKDFSSLAPALSSNKTPPLSESQAIGTVAASQTNFRRVIVQPERSSSDGVDPKVGVELLCVVRDVLKKIKRRVLVGDKTLEAWKKRLRSWGYEPLFCSAETKNGLDSLIRGLGRFQQEVVEESILLDMFLCFRCQEGVFSPIHPGFNQPSLLKTTKHSLAQAFPEVVCLLTIRKMLRDMEPAKCSFNNCLHIGEPGCIFKGDWERYPYYFQLLDEIRIREEFQLRMFGSKREGDFRYKVGDMGIQRAEPRLEPKKHRRQSRKRINQSILNELDELDDDDSLDLENDPIVRAIENENR